MSSVLVCGGRDYADYAWLRTVLFAWTEPGDTVIHGGCRGTDYMAGRFARENGRNELVFEADWKTHGRAAGPLRNQRMLDEGKPEVVIAFPGGRGTADMLKRAEKAGVSIVMGAAL